MCRDILKKNENFISTQRIYYKHMGYIEDLFQHIINDPSKVQKIQRFQQNQIDINNHSGDTYDTDTVNTILCICETAYSARGEISNPIKNLQITPDFSLWILPEPGTVYPYNYFFIKMKGDENVFVFHYGNFYGFANMDMIRTKFDI